MTLDSILLGGKWLIVIICLFDGIKLLINKEARLSSYTSYKKACKLIGGSCLFAAIANFIQLNQWGFEHHHLGCCCIFFVTIHFTLLFLFVSALIILYSGKSINKRLLLKFVLPAVTLLISYCISLLFQEDKFTTDFSQLIINCQTCLPSCIRLIYGIVFIFLVFLFFRLYFAEKKKFDETISNFENEKEIQSKVKWITYSAIIITLMGITAAFTTFYPNVYTEFVFMIATIIFYNFFPSFYLSYNSSYNELKELIKRNLEGNKIETRDDAKTDETINDGLGTVFNVFEQKNKDLYQRFDTYFMDKKPYLESSMKIEDVIKNFGSNRTNIGIAIHQEKKMTIGKYIMIARIEHAKQLLLADSNSKIEVVAMESGYSSVRTFNRNFKDIVGVTPENFRFQHKG